MTEPASDRVKMRRGANRADYTQDSIRAVLDAGMVAHVGVSTDEGPIVLPMIYGRTDEVLYLHGAVANAMLRGGTNAEVCATVTIVDGLVVARTPFHNSMNYRSVVVRGLATKVTDPDERLVALKLMTDHIVELWDNQRPPSEIDLKKTLVLSVPLTEASAKIRGGDPIDEPEDLAGPHWAGVVPLETRWQLPYDAADLTSGVDVPAPVRALASPDPTP